MAGSGLIAIKRRIKSITSTQKITKAMGLVATAKLKKTRDKLEFLDSFYNSFNTTMEMVLDNHEEGYNVYISGNESKRKLYIILTSDSGLCGGFNTNLFKAAEEELKRDVDDNVVIVSGQKGSAYFKKTNYAVKAQYINVSDIPDLKDVDDITNDALGMYLNNEVGEVNVIYTEFISQMKQEIRIEKLLPLREEKTNDNIHLDSEGYVEIEPKADELIHSVIKLYLKQKILKFMTHSKTSEQAIRMSAMDGATKNANELLDNLKLMFNRMRQGAITQEITEIVGGSEAQK